MKIKRLTLFGGVFTLILLVAALLPGFNQLAKADG
jgi:hypothetical protein